MPAQPKPVTWFYREIPKDDFPGFAVCPTVTKRLKLLSVHGKLEDRIQQLCAKVQATHDDEELVRLCIELRQALGEHVKKLREQVAEYQNSSKPGSRKGN